MANTNQFIKNHEYTGQVVDLTSQGQGVVKIDNYPFFVEGTITGEEVKFKATKVGKKFGYGRLMEILEESPDRVEIKDPIGRQIGTMTLQHMTYEAQLKYKEQQVRSAYERIGNFPNVEVRPVLGMDHPWEYRNKAQIPVRQINGQLETGFFRRNSHDLVPVENFHIQHPEIDQVILTVRDILRKFQVPAYDEKSHKGNIRHIVVKRGHYSGEIMVILVSRQRSIPSIQEIINEITAKVPNLVSLVQNIQSDKTNVILGQKNRLLWGQSYYTDSMLGLDFKVSANSFYQVNTPQAEKLYQTAIEAAGLSGSETVLDAYSGIGSISLSLAKEAKHVYAMEIVEEAVDMAKKNAQLNKLDNVTFEAGPAEEWLPRWQEQGIHFDVAVVDPPRKGLDPSFITSLLEIQPDKIVYVSCNPATQARDARMLADGGYQLEWVQPVDLFAQTVHTEAVALFTRKN